MCPSGRGWIGARPGPASNQRTAKAKIKSGRRWKGRCRRRFVVMPSPCEARPVVTLMGTAGILWRPYPMFGFSKQELNVKTALSLWARGRGGMCKIRILAAAICAIALSGCATPAPQPVAIIAPSAVQPAKQQALQPSQPTLKRKIAIGRFSNSTNYGRALLLDGQKDPLAEQASDMLMSRLVDTGQFIVLERDDLDAVKAEAQLSGNKPTLVAADALIIGSVTQFGRQTEGKVGFLSSTKKQSASATVEIRLVDPRTGVAFFSTSGTGSASVEAGEVAGFGSRAAYDSTLTDRAIAAAISDLTTNVIQKLQERPWTTDILNAVNDQVQISGGPSQGIKIGDEFAVETKGKIVQSGQSGIPITLPGTQIARIKVISFFGSGEAEGATAQVIDGSVPAADRASLIVKEVRR